MPLSEDEQRILTEIEQQLYRSDPSLARDIADTTVYTHAYRNLKWSLFGFVVGLGVLIFTLSTSYLLAFVGFLIMLVCALAVERNLRRLGRAGIQQVTRSMKAAGLRDAVGNTSDRLKDRMRRRDEN